MTDIVILYFAEEPPPELVEKSQISQPFYYMDMKMAIPVLGTFVTVLVIVCTAFICLKKSKFYILKFVFVVHCLYFVV